VWQDPWSLNLTLDVANLASHASHHRQPNHCSLLLRSGWVLPHHDVLTPHIRAYIQTDRDLANSFLIKEYTIFMPPTRASHSVG
jgi:hypothetical protein